MAFVLGMYVALLAYIIPRHEPWADEAQAWQLAKYLSLRELFGTYLHYEFTPGLWHCCLWLMSRLHVTYSGMHWATALIALAGVAVLMARSPFPFVMRLMLPFTYFFAFQYSVVARNYVLMAPLLFVLACVWPERRNQPLPIALLLGLMANVSVHGLVIAVGLVASLLIEWRVERRAAREAALTEERKAEGKRCVWSATVFVLFLMFAAWCLMPPADATWFLAMKHARLHPTSPSTIQPAAGVAARSDAWPDLLGMVLRQKDRLAEMLSIGVCGREVVAYAAWLLLGWLWMRERTLRYALPVILLLFLGRLARFSFYHAGLLWLLLLFLAWVTWPHGGSWRRGWTGLGFQLVLLLCMGSQLKWTARVVRFDTQKAYAPDRDAARLLRAYVERGERVDVAVPEQGTRLEHGEFFVTGLEPYFQTEPIANMRARFWIWKGDEDMRAIYLRDTAARAVVVVMEQTAEDSRWPAEVERLQALGYQPAARVCGQNFYPRYFALELCDAFYEPPR